MATSFYSFEGKKAVVVGGSSGMGFATAQLFVSLGGEVVIASRNKERIDEAVSKLGAKASGAVLDATDEEKVKAFFAGLGEFDHLVSSSGRAADKPFLQSSLAELKAIWDRKYWQYVLVSRYGAPNLRPGGSITFIGGGLGTKPAKASSQASGGNAAIEGLARALALELAPLRVNVVAPGLIDTPLWDQLAPTAEARSGMLEGAKKGLPVATVGTAEEIGRMIIAILSSPFATGTVFHVNGGSFLV